MAAFLAAAVAAIAAPSAERCNASSGANRAALLELYTSEGCSGCPPAEDWLRRLRARGFGPDTIVPLAFHVDYWDHLGWRDRFAQTVFSARQQAAAGHLRAQFVYTPQLLLDGKDLRQSWLDDRWIDLLHREIEAAPGAALALSQRADNRQLHVDLEVRSADSLATDAFVAVFESGLSTDVKRGENADRRLVHDFVVRTLLGPLYGAAGTAARHKVSIELAPDWNHANLGIAAFAVEVESGETLQAMAVPICSLR